MASGVHSSGLFPNHLDRDFDKDFFDEYTRAKGEHTQFAKFETAKSSYIQEMDTIGLGAVQDMYEGQPIPFERITEGYTKKITFDNFGLGLQFTENAWEDDQYGALKKAPGELGKAFEYTKDLKWFDLLNSGFVTTTRAANDTKALFASDHPSQGVTGSTFDNSGTGSLTMTTLQAILNHFENMENEKGIPIPYDGDKVLLIHPDLKWKAKELMISEYNPENANNAVNVLQNEGLTYKVVHFLTSSAPYFVLCTGKHDLRFIWRRKIKTGSFTDFHTGNFLYKATARWQTDFIRWRGVYGSTGV